MFRPEKYTLIVPTYNRPVLLNGLLGHLATKRASFPILVLDSSQSAHRDQNSRIISKYKLNTQHVLFDENIAFQSKISAQLAKVETPYVSLCADDDLVFPGAIEACVKELEAADDTVACHACLSP